MATPGPCGVSAGQGHWRAESAGRPVRGGRAAGALPRLPAVPQPQEGGAAGSLPGGTCGAGWGALSAAPPPPLWLGLFLFLFSLRQQQGRNVCSKNTGLRACWRVGIADLCLEQLGLGSGRAFAREEARLGPNVRRGAWTISGSLLSGGPAPSRSLPGPGKRSGARGRGGFVTGRVGQGGWREVPVGGSRVSPGARARGGTAVTARLTQLRASPLLRRVLCLPPAAGRAPAAVGGRGHEKAGAGPLPPRRRPAPGLLLPEARDSVVPPGPGGLPV